MGFFRQITGIIPIAKIKVRIKHFEHDNPVIRKHATIGPAQQIHPSPIQSPVMLLPDQQQCGFDLVLILGRDHWGDQRQGLRAARRGFCDLFSFQKALIRGAHRKLICQFQACPCDAGLRGQKLLRKIVLREQKDARHIPQIRHRGTAGDQDGAANGQPVTNFGRNLVFRNRPICLCARGKAGQDNIHAPQIAGQLVQGYVLFDDHTFRFKIALQ
mmetsp:Transcript_23218/g.39872  ORF Transcript_23218/g.39872 Transcript_23218/m.39872 type:complete len:215 (-) Transcript_23218:7630-8274(-)